MVVLTKNPQIDLFKNYWQYAGNLVVIIRCHGWQQFKSYWKSLSHRWKCLRLHNAPIIADRSQQQHTKGPCQPDLPMRHAPGEKDMVSKLSEEDMVIGVIWYPNSNVKLWAISRH